MRILAVLFGCLVYLLGAMSRVAVPGMVFEKIASEYALSASQVALLPSVGVFGCLAFIGIGGVAVDRFGWMKMLLFGSLLQAFGYIPVHESSSLLLMLAGEFLNGGGRTIVYLSILKLFDVSFERRYFAAMIGVSMCSAMAERWGRVRSSRGWSRPVVLGSSQHGSSTSEHLPARRHLRFWR